MAAWAPKRFWSDVHVEPLASGFGIRLDKSPLRTPAKQPLFLPTHDLAQAVAVEWQAQDGAVQPASMPLTRYANSAIDKVVPQLAAVVAVVAAYGASDLLCYRAADPQTLIDRQAEAWDPCLAWAGQDLDAPLIVTTGVMPVAQPPESLQNLTQAVARLSPFALAAFHDLAAISGSLVLALAVARGHMTRDAAWNACRIDENWQAEVWGTDEEAAQTAALREDAFAQAERFLQMCG